VKKRIQANIEALIEKEIWPGAGLDPREITMIRPFENDTPNKAWDSAGMALKVWFGNDCEIVLNGGMIDDALQSGNCQPLIERVRSLIASHAT
jgi:hypothetical protein